MLRLRQDCISVQYKFCCRRHMQMFIVHIPSIFVCVCVAPDPCHEPKVSGKSLFLLFHFFLFSYLLCFSYRYVARNFVLQNALEIVGKEEGE